VTQEPNLWCGRPLPPASRRRGPEVQRLAELEANTSGRRVLMIDRILLALSRGPRTSADLARITARYGARIYDLRRLGWTIQTGPGRGGEHEYRLVAGPQGPIGGTGAESGKTVDGRGGI